MNLEGQLYASIQDLGAEVGSVLKLNASAVWVTVRASAVTSLCNPGAVLLNATGTISVSPELVGDIQQVCALTCDDVDGFADRQACRLALGRRSVGDIMRDVIGSGFQCEDLTTPTYDFPLLDKVVEIPALRQALGAVSAFDPTVLRLGVSDFLLATPEPVLQVIGRVLRFTGTDLSAYVKNFRVMSTGVQMDLWSDIDVLNTRKSRVCDTWADLMDTRLFLTVTVGKLLDKLGLDELKTCPVGLVVSLVERALDALNGRRQRELGVGAGGVVQGGPPSLPHGMTGSGALLHGTPQQLLAALEGGLSCSAPTCLASAARLALNRAFALVTPEGRAATSAALKQLRAEAQEQVGTAHEGEGRGLQGVQHFALLNISSNLVNVVRGILGPRSKWPTFLSFDYPATGLGVITVGRPGPTCDMLAREMQLRVSGATLAQLAGQERQLAAALARWVVDKWGMGMPGLMATQFRDIVLQAADAPSGQRTRRLQGADHVLVTFNTLSGSGVSSGRLNAELQEGARSGDMSLAVSPTLTLTVHGGEGDTQCDEEGAAAVTCDDPRAAQDAMVGVVEVVGNDGRNEGTAEVDGTGGALPGAGNAADTNTNTSSSPSAAATAGWAVAGVALAVLLAAVVFLALAVAGQLPPGLTPAWIKPRGAAARRVGRIRQANEAQGPACDVVGITVPPVVGRGSRSGSRSARRGSTSSRKGSVGRNPLVAKIARSGSRGGGSAAAQ